MAFTDFDLLGTQTTVLHSAAPLTTNPLTSSLAGAYCRKLEYSGSFPPKIYFTSSSYGGAFYNTPITKVISGRAHLRIEGNSSNLISIKDTTIFNSTSTTKGYSFGIQTNGYFGFRSLVLFGNDNIALKATQVPNQYVSYDTWYSLRMDVFPLGPLGDRIICYQEVISSGSNTSSPGSGIWNSTLDGTLFDITVSPEDPAYAAWSSSAMNGISSHVPTSICYVDNINFTTYNAP